MTGQLKRISWVGGVLLFFVLLDQGTKWMAIHYLKGHAPHFVSGKLVPT